MAEQNPTKICTKCKQEFPATFEFFRKSNQQKTGFFPRCRPCDKASQREYSKRRSPEYRSWLAMKSRCSDPNTPYYPRYGGRGITVCDRWRNNFDAFLEDMGPRPSLEYSLDRFPDKNGNYEPSNCRWATKKEQALNRRNNHMVTIDGETHCVNEWAEIKGLSQATLFERLQVEPIDARILRPARRYGSKRKRITE